VLVHHGRHLLLLTKKFMNDFRSGRAMGISVAFQSRTLPYPSLGCSRGISELVHWLLVV